MTNRSIVTGVAAALMAAVMLPSSVFGLAISPGSAVALGNTANSILQVSNPAARGTGSIIKMQPDGAGGTDLIVLTADHVVRDAAGGGSALYTPNQINVTFGGGGATFSASNAVTDFTLPEDGSSAVDLAMLDVDVPKSKLNQLPANLFALTLPAAQPAANTAITQAGYGLQGGVTTVSGNLAYVYSPVNSLGAAYGTLKAGPNTIGAGGVTSITGATSAYAAQPYVYDGFQNGALINGVNPNYNGSTSYVFSGDSGGPSLSGTTLLGVHSSSVTGKIVGDANSEFAYANNVNYQWQDVSVFDNLTWINATMATISPPVPEPVGSGLLLIGVVGFLCKRRAGRAIRA